MALIECNECGNEVSNKAHACPKCGNPDLEASEPVIGKEHIDKPKSMNQTMKDYWASGKTPKPITRQPMTGIKMFVVIVGALLFFFIGLPIILWLLMIGSI